MTTHLATRRRSRALTLSLIAAGLAALAAVVLGIQARSSRPDLAVGPVVPGLAQNIANAQRITVTSASASYRIERTQRGWAMRDRGNYPVERAPLERLTRGLEQLQHVRRMTSDPSKHDRLGVGDPRQGGRGILVQIERADGAFLVNLILGVETNGLYARKPNENQAWAVRGELPPLRDVATWLDLSPLQLEASTLARVEVMPPTGPSYILARENADAPNFDIISPARLAPLAPTTVTSAAEHITQLSPIDVQTAPEIQGTPSARVRATTFDGVSIDGELIQSDNRTWIKLVARSANPSQAAAVQAINDRASGWAYALSPEDVRALVPALSDLVPRAGPDTAPRAPVTPPAPAP